MSVSSLLGESLLTQGFTGGGNTTVLVPAKPVRVTQAARKATVAQGLTLPYPACANERLQPVKFGPRKMGMTLTAKYRKYLADARAIVKASEIEPFEGDVKVTILVYRMRNKGDIDGIVKAALDVLQACEETGGYGMYKNDSQVGVCTLIREPNDKEDPRIEILCESIRDYKND